MRFERPQLSLGIEEEYLIVDPATRDLATAPPKGFMEDCRNALGERVSHELLQAQVEISTPVCRNIKEARTALASLRRTVSDCAQSHGLALMAASTHPSASWRDQRHVDMDRYRILTQDLQTVAERLVICGMHVHAGIENNDLRIDLMNQMVYFLPHLLALSTSSPFWEGRLTGLKAFRPTIFGDLPRTGLPERIASYSEWQDLLRVLAQSGVCDDPSKIWWDIRPSIKQPTLELRVCDICTRLEDAISIAALYQSILKMLVELRAKNQSWRYYRPLLVAENKWRAQRYGITGDLADFGRGELVAFKDLIEELTGLVREHARDLDCLPEVERLGEIVSSGTSADRQIDIYNRSIEAGADPEEARQAVVDWLVATTLEGTDGE